MTNVDKGVFFNCQIVWSVDDLVGDEPFVLFTDTWSDPFTEALILATRGTTGFRGTVSTVADIPKDECLVFCEGPVWHRNHQALNASGISGKRAHVFLYFDDDPSGSWDFAKGCGSSLSQIFSERGLTGDTLSAISPFLERWPGGRAIHGRFAPLIKFATRDFPDQIKANSDKIVRIMAALADDKSREAYSRIMFGTSEQILAGFSRIVWGPQQYMEIANLKPGDVIFNCGVNRGWEIPYFLTQTKGEGHIYNFDPTIGYENSAYGGFIDAFKDVIHDHRIILTDRDGTIDLPIHFTEMVRSDDIAQEGADPAEYKTYPCRQIDSLMNEGVAHRLDYLKMDVEGGEIFILKGAIGAIKKYRPKLAVAIYHEPNHFWDYPEYLLDNLEDYRYYVRQYGYSRFETLLYAIPKEQVASGSGEEALNSLASARSIALRDERPHQIDFYFRDRDVSPREHYSKTMRVLTRFSGQSWSTADLVPMPNIEADHVVSVNKTPKALVIFTKHAYDPEKIRLTAAVVRESTDMDYIVDRASHDKELCLPIWSDDGIARILSWNPDAKEALITRFENSALHDELKVPCPDSPLFATKIKGKWQLWTQGQGKEVVRIHDVVGHVLGTKLKLVKDVTLPGQFFGLGSIKTYANGVSLSSPIIISRSEGTMVSIHEASESAKLIQQLPWDDRIDIIPTTE